MKQQVKYEEDSVFFDILMKNDLFKDINNWEITRFSTGLTGQHTYRFQKDNKDFVVKEVTPHECLVYQLFSDLDIKIGPAVLAKDLLNENIVIYEYINGDYHQEMILPDHLVINYAKMQNQLNDLEVFEGYPSYNGCKSMIEDDGFYEGGFKYCLIEGLKNLEVIRKYGLSLIDEMIDIGNHILKDADKLAQEYAKMPFGWLHNDFRGQHIVTDINNNCKVIDWGSSFGHGPFLNDLAPYLINDKHAKELFYNNSESCNNITMEQFDRWLYLSLCQHYNIFIKWWLEDFGYTEFKPSKGKCQKLLEKKLNIYKKINKSLT